MQLTNAPLQFLDVPVLLLDIGKRVLRCATHVTKLKYSTLSQPCTLHPHADITITVCTCERADGHSGKDGAAVALQHFADLLQAAASGG